MFQIYRVNMIHNAQNNVQYQDKGMRFALQARDEVET
jgi:hypothetical protein